MGEWSKPLVLIDETPTLAAILEHLMHLLIADWQLLGVYIVNHLLRCDSVIEVAIDVITEFADAVHGDLKWLITLIQIFLGAREITSHSQILHTDDLELRLGLHSILVNE